MPVFDTAPVGLEVWVDHSCVYNNNQVRKEQYFCTDIDNSIGDHELRFVLKNKCRLHTKVQHNHIVKDSYIIIKNLSFDDIELRSMIEDYAIYSHDHNGVGPKIQEPFKEVMGCNGVVSLKFSTPALTWMLNNYISI